MGSVNFDRSIGIPTTVPQDRLSFRKITGNFAELYVGSNSDVPIKVTDSNKQATLVSGTNIKTVNNVSLLGSGNVPITSGLVSNLTCAVPLVNVNNQNNPTYYAMVQTTPNTLGGSVDASGYWVVPTTGVYDIYVEGRPDIRNDGGIYGVFSYVVHNHTTDVKLLENDCNFVVNGTIGMWNKGVAMGISLIAGQLIKFGQHMYMNSAAGGYVAAHTAKIRFISR